LRHHAFAESDERTARIAARERQPAAQFLQDVLGVVDVFSRFHPAPHVGRERLRLDPVASP